MTTNKKDNKTIVNYFTKNIFTIEDKKDPFWEDACRKCATELIVKLAEGGKSQEEILEVISSEKTLKGIEKLFTDNDVELPSAKVTKDSILKIFKQKLENSKNLQKNEVKDCDPIKSRVDSVLEFFTVEDKKDPAWETMCREIAEKLIRVYAKKGSTHYILVKMQGLTSVKEIEQTLIDNNIELPEAKKTRSSVLKIFKEKINNIRKHLDKKASTGIKY